MSKDLVLTKQTETVTNSKLRQTTKQLFKRSLRQTKLTSKEKNQTQ